MRELFNRAAYWLADNWSAEKLVKAFGVLCFFCGLIVGMLLEKVL